METTNLAAEDILWALRRLPIPLRDYMQKVKPGQTFLAGGFIRACVANESVSDIDVFVPSADAAAAGALAMAARMGKSGCPLKVVQTENAHTVCAKPYPIQFIHRWTFSNPVDAIASFDFSIAQAAIWFNPDTSRWTSCASSRFYQDLAAKRLVYLSPERNEDAGGSMLRVLKFYQKGYRIPLESLGAVIARLTKAVDMDAIKLTAELDHITNEQQMAKVLSGLLREVDPNVGHLTEQNVGYFAGIKQSQDEIGAAIEGEL